MAGGAHVLWISFFLSCFFKTSQNSNGHAYVNFDDDFREDDMLSKIPSVQTCPGLNEQLMSLNNQLQQATFRNRQLDEEAFGLRREVRLLELQLATCSSTASAVAGSYRAQLQNKMNQLLEKSDNDTFLILKVIQLTHEVTTLQKRIKLADNSTDATTQNSLLQKKLQEKINELDSKKQQVERSHTNATLIFQIISLQNEIWDLEQDDLKKGQSALLLDRRIIGLQVQLDMKIKELYDIGDASSEMLELLFVHTKIAAKHRLISLHIEKSKAAAADYQRQWKLKADLLKKKILELNRDENNKELTKEILTHQMEVENLSQLMSDAKYIIDTHLKELRGDLEQEKKQQENLLKQLEENDYAQAQLIMKIISIMKEVRELQTDEQQQTSTTQATSLLALLQAKEAEFAKAQAEISELQRKLQNMTENFFGDGQRYNQTNMEFKQKVAELKRSGGHTAELIIDMINLHDEIQILKDLISTTEDPDRVLELQRELEKTQDNLNSKTAELQICLPTKLQLENEECSGHTGRNEKLKTEFEQKIAELNRTGDSNAALVLTVMNLHDELTCLRDLTSKTKDIKKKSDLINQQKKKQLELQAGRTDIDRLIANSFAILTIMDLQNEISDLQRNGTNETKGKDVEELYNRVHGFISEINEEDDETLKLMLKILTLQSQIDHLKRLMSDNKVMNSTEVNKLTNDLQKYMTDLNQKNPANASLILTLADLKNQLKNRRLDNQNENEAAAATIIKLTEQLRLKAEEHIQDQAEIKALQNKLNQMEEQCSGFEQKLKGLQNELDDKMHKLLSKSDTVTSLALQVSTLTLQLEELKRQLQNTESQPKIEELQKIIDEKNNELANKTEELKARSSQAQRLLKIISIQTEIEKNMSEATNDTDYDKINALQDYVNNLIGGIQDENNENTKLMFEILSQQDEIARLKKQEEAQTNGQLEKIKELQNELEDIRSQIKEKTLMLKFSDTRITNLSSQIMELHQKIEPLEDEISDLKQLNAETVAEIQERLSLTKRQLQDSELLLKDADTKNFNSIMEIADLRAQLKKAQKKASRAAGKNANELEQQIQTQQREIRKLESTNTDLKQEIENLKTCCSETTDCGGVHRQLQQSQEDADRLQQQLQDKNDQLSLLREELKNQASVTEKLQSDYSILQNEKNQLEETLQALQNKPDVEDTTVHTTKMTFDPNTAHPRVALSADNTAMSTSEEVQNVPANSKRFDIDLAVLGATGFSSGRHYWEVSVAGKICYHLGMTSESAPRKGSILYRPTNGYWTIVLNKQGQFKAFNREQVIIPVQTQPLTLGILLDYKKGQISFYDAGSRAQIYSFVGQSFEDKIYPFVNYCVEDVENPAPIVLLTPRSVDWI